MIVLITKEWNRIEYCRIEQSRIGYNSRAVQCCVERNETEQKRKDLKGYEAIAWFDTKHTYLSQFVYFGANQSQIMPNMPSSDNNQNKPVYLNPVKFLF